MKRAADRTSSDSHEVHIVADVAREILTHRGLSSRYSKSPVPTNLSLPAGLFFRPSERKACNDVNTLPRGFKLLDSIGRYGGAAPGGSLVAVSKRASTAGRSHCFVSRCI